MLQLTCVYQMHPSNISDKRFSYYSSRESEETRGQKGIRENKELESGRKFQTVGFSHDRPSTSAPHRDRSPIKRNVDPYLDDLKYNVVNKMHSFKTSYMGGLHARWLRNLFDQTQGNLSLNKKNEYIQELYASTDSIKSWTVEAAVNFYTSMTKMDFFTDVHELSDSSRSKVKKLHTDLTNLIAKKLYLLSCSDERGIRNYITLFSAVAKSDFILKDAKYEPSARDIVKQITDTLFYYRKPLNIFLYRWVMSYILDFTKRNGHLYSGIFDKLAEKHLHEVNLLTISKEDNLNLSKFLVNFSNSLNYAAVFSSSLKKGMEKLIKKVDLKDNIIGSYLGFRAIMSYLSKAELPLNETTERKIEECLSFIEENKKNLDLNGSVYLTHSISFLYNKSKITPKSKALLNFCLKNLERDKHRLATKELSILLKTITNFSAANFECFDYFKLAAYIFENKLDELYALPDTYLHSFFCELGVACRTMIKKDMLSYALIKSKFEKELNNLIKEYSKYILNADLPEKINGFRALSTLAVYGMQPNSSTRHILRKLFNILDAEKRISDLSTNSLATYFGSVIRLGNLIELDIDKYAKLFINYGNEFVENNENNSKKNLMLWGTLVFYAANKEKLNETRQHKLQRVIEKLYKSIDKDRMIGEHEKQTLLMARFWVNDVREEKSLYESDASGIQVMVLNELKNEFKNEYFESEVSIKNLPPCDIIMPDRRIVIEVQGPHHFLDKNNKYKTGTTMFKLASYREAGFKVIEIFADGSMEKEQQSLRCCIEEISKIVKKPTFS